MGRRLSLGRIWALVALLYAITFIFMFADEGESNRGARMFFTIVSSSAMLFALAYSFFRAVRWAFTRQREASDEPVSVLEARVQELEHTLTTKQLKEKIADLERRLDEKNRQEGDRN